MSPSGSRDVRLLRVDAAARTDAHDVVAVEEPMEVRVNGAPFAVIMRTPGADRELAAGFLLAEDVIRGSDEIAMIEYCEQDQGSGTRAPGSGTAEPETSKREQNTLNVTVIGDAIDRLDARLSDRRQVMMTASCGLCGRRTIDSLRARVPSVTGHWTISAEILRGLPAKLRDAQRVFETTGGLHAAGLFALDGTLLVSAEDVGRHNAVDKVVGRRLLEDALPLDQTLLVVSGRTSFELVQKALLAGVPLIAAVSAPSSLAIELAQEANVTLCGFLRGETFNIYAHAQRVT
ncbi:MAG TPA: formate dehydrogenase accessory sulfurtransferase FdhD [Vicinamibacterales bacterium]|nr:formate dehydrogenase accessory sulfurtransferase FdhD [Vicinamibacterales bacterium]